MSQSEGHGTLETLPSADVWASLYAHMWPFPSRSLPGYLRSAPCHIPISKALCVAPLSYYPVFCFFFSKGLFIHLSWETTLDSLIPHLLSVLGIHSANTKAWINICSISIFAGLHINMWPSHQYVCHYFNFCLFVFVVFTSNSEYLPGSASRMLGFKGLHHHHLSWPCWSGTHYVDWICFEFTQTHILLPLKRWD